MLTLQRWFRVGMLLAVAFSLLGGGLLAQAGAGRPEEQTLAPAGTYRAYLPLLRSAGQAVGRVEVAPDTLAQVSAPIGPAGGSLKTVGADGTSYELVIPPDALDFTEVFTLTPALRVGGLPLSGGALGAANLEPTGLQLYAPAQLRITPVAAPTGLTTVGFGYRGAGEQFHLRPLALSQPSVQLQAQAAVITLETIVIKPMGAGRGSQAEIDRQQQTSPPDPHDAAAQQVADPGPFDSLALAVVYSISVRPGLLSALQQEALVDDAIAGFTEWMVWVDAAGLRTNMLSEYSEGRGLIRQLLLRAAAGASERCVTQKRPEEGFRLLRYLRYARLYLDTPEVMALEAKLRSCLTFRVQLHTWITEDAGDWGWKHMLHSEPFVLRWQHGMRATGSGALTYDSVEWIGEPIGLCVLSGSGAGSTINAASEPYGLTLTPVSRTSAAVTVAFSYDPGTPVETKSIWCPDAPGGTGQRTHWRDYYTQMHAYERHGSGFRAQVTIVGAGTFTGWVYNHTGVGSEGPLQEETSIEIEHTPQP